MSLLVQLPVDAYYLHLASSLFICLSITIFAILIFIKDQEVKTKLKWFKSPFDESIQDGHLGNWVIFTIQLKTQR